MNRSLLALGLLLVGAVAAPAMADPVYYPYYYPRYRPAIFQPPAWARPNAAALAPWAWNFNFGGGPVPVLGNNNQLKDGWTFNVGGGYNFSPQAGFVLEFMNTGLGLTDSQLQQHNGATDGDAWIWSVTLNPIWRFRLAGPVGAYLIGGGGFYQLEKRFTEPATIFVPTWNGGYDTSGFVDEHEYDNTGGVNVGAGLTCNLGWGTKFYVEARYHYVFTAGTPTQIIPITFGLRW